MKSCFSFFITLSLLAGILQSASAQWEEAGGTRYFFQANFEDSGTIYMGVDTFFGGGGVFCSSDSNEGWDTVGMGKAFVHSFTGLHEEVFAATNTGVYRSAGVGTSWTLILPDMPTVLASAGDTLFATGNGTLYRTSDDGAEWDSIPNNFGGRITELFYANGSLFAAVGDTVFSSMNGGMNWTQSVLTFRNTADFAASDNYVYTLGTTGVLVSSDNGTNWLSSLQMPADTGEFNSLITADNFLIAARADGGIVFSTDHGARWGSVQGPTSDVTSGLAIVLGMLIDGNYLFLIVGDTDALVFLRRPFADLGVQSSTATLPSVGIFPNPSSSSYFQISGAGTSVELIDMLGRTMLTQTIMGIGRVDVSHIPHGSYEAIVYSASGIVTIPVIIQH